MREKDNKHCPKCKHILKEKIERNTRGGWLKYFKCSYCRQSLAYTKKRIKGRLRKVLYIDDVEHMGLMTSGPGGY